MSNKFEWLPPTDNEGEFLFTFDGIKVYNLFQDYPFNMTDEEVKIFSEAEPYWRSFFAYRFERSAK